ncbi:hypothetical protein RUND412_005159 [Rhizina undulata]
MEEVTDPSRTPLTPLPNDAPITKERKKPGPKPGYKRKKPDEISTPATAENAPSTCSTAPKERKKPGPKPGWKKNPLLDSPSSKPSATRIRHAYTQGQKNFIYYYRHVLRVEPRYVHQWFRDYHNDNTYNDGALQQLFERIMKQKKGESGDAPALPAPPGGWGHRDERIDWDRLNELAGKNDSWYFGRERREIVEWKLSVDVIEDLDEDDMEWLKEHKEEFGLTEADLVTITTHRPAKRAKLMMDQSASDASDSSEATGEAESDQEMEDDDEDLDEELERPPVKIKLTGQHLSYRQ